MFHKDLIPGFEGFWVSIFGAQGLSVEDWQVFRVGLEVSGLRFSGFIGIAIVLSTSQVVNDKAGRAKTQE